MKLKKVGIDIVHGCQLRCIGCPNSTLKPKIEFCDPADFEKMLGNIDAKVEILRLYNFGEPMLHPHLDEMVKIVGKSRLKPKKVEISTNAQYWSDKTFRNTLKQKIVTDLYVSCDGDGTARSYESTRPPAKWSRFIHFINEMKEFRDELCPKMHLGARVITHKNYEKQWKKVLVGYKPEFRGWSTRVDTVADPWKQRKIPNGPCKFVRNNDSLYVDYDGTVVPCCVHPRASTLGSLLKSDTFSIMYNITINRGLLSGCMYLNRKSMDICGSCSKS